MVVKTTTRKVKVLELKEKAVSKKQQRFFGMVRAAQKGEGAASPEVAKVAGEISKKDAKDFAKTKHKGLPERKDVKEEPERTSAYKAMQASLHPRGSTVDAKQRGENATAHRVGGWRNPKNRGKKRKVMAEFEPELEMVEELTGDMKTDLEKYRVPRGPGGNPIRMGDKVRSMKGDQPLGKLKVKYGADKVREYYKKNKAVGESAVLDANKKLETQAWRKKKQKEYAKLIAIYNHQKNLQQRGLGDSTKRKKTSESFEIDKSAHKKAQRQSKIRNLAKDNKNPNEKAAAERKLKGPKLAWEEFKKHI